MTGGAAREHVTIDMMGVPACSVDGDVRVNLSKYGMIVDADEGCGGGGLRLLERVRCSEDTEESGVLGWGI
jgi:hypothetical protein